MTNPRPDAQTYPRYVIMKNRESGTWLVFLAFRDWQGVYHHRIARFRGNEAARRYVRLLLPSAWNIYTARALRDVAGVRSPVDDA